MEWEDDGRMEATSSLHEPPNRRPSVSSAWRLSTFCSANVKFNSDYGVHQNNESLNGHCTNERRVRNGIKKSEKRCDLRRQQKMERQGQHAAVTCDGRLFHRQAAATGINALSPTVDRRVTDTYMQTAIKKLLKQVRNRNDSGSNGSTILDNGSCESRVTHLSISLFTI